MPRWLVGIVAALAGIASGCSTAPDKPQVKVEIVRPTLPTFATEPCQRPVTLPDRGITGAEATAYWGRDRKALESCEAKRAAAVGAVHGGE
jgi:hypothetical protein